MHKDDYAIEPDDELETRREHQDGQCYAGNHIVGLGYVCEWCGSYVREYDTMAEFRDEA